MIYSLDDPTVQTWLHSLNEQSLNSYNKKLVDYLNFLVHIEPEIPDHHKACEAYILNLHDENYMVSTIRSMYSVISTFHQNHPPAWEPYKVLKQLNHLLNQWEKVDSTKKSEVTIYLKTCPHYSIAMTFNYYII